LHSTSAIVSYKEAVTKPVKNSTTKTRQPTLLYVQAYVGARVVSRLLYSRFPSAAIPTYVQEYPYVIGQLLLARKQLVEKHGALSAAVTIVTT